MPLVAKAKKFVGTVSRSSIVRERLHQLQVEAKEKYDLAVERGEVVDDFQRLHPLNVVKDVITRWSSTFSMLQRLVKLRVHIESMQREGLASADFSAQEWAAMRQLVELLEPFAAATKELEGIKYPTLPLVWRWLVRLKRVCADDAILAWEPDVRAVRDRLVEVMDEQDEDSYIQVDDLLRAAAAADPAVKVGQCGVELLLNCVRFHCACGASSSALIVVRPCST